MASERSDAWPARTDRQGHKQGPPIHQHHPPRMAVGHHPSPENDPSGLTPPQRAGASGSETRGRGLCAGLSGLSPQPGTRPGLLWYQALNRGVSRAYRRASATGCLPFVYPWALSAPYCVPALASKRSTSVVSQPARRSTMSRRRRGPKPEALAAWRQDGILVDPTTYLWRVWGYARLSERSAGRWTPTRRRGRVSDLPLYTPSWSPASLPPRRGPPPRTDASVPSGRAFRPRYPLVDSHDGAGVVSSERSAKPGGPPMVRGSRGGVAPPIWLNLQPIALRTVPAPWGGLFD